MHATARRISTLSLACCAVLLAACSGPDQKVGQDRISTPHTCVADVDCSSDGSKVCVGGICINNEQPSCANGEACPDGMVCNDLQGLCVPQGTDGGAGDGGSNSLCSGRCECQMDEACTNSHCVASVVGVAACAQDSQCGRGQICDVLSHKCKAGCIDSCDCAAPKTCSTTRFQCEACSASNPCPAGQICSGSGDTAQCVPSTSCTTSSDCNSASPGTICVSGTCANCTLDNQCQATPYGGGFICSSGHCQTGCNVNQCQTTCTQQGKTCNTSTCQCELSCSDSNCGGSACTGSDHCDVNTCTCSSGPSDCASSGCSNGQACVMTSASGLPGCGTGQSACAPDCSFNSCQSGWECIDLANSTCGLSTDTGSSTVCAKDCNSDADCPSGQPCCATFEGPTVCSALGACISM